MLRSSMKMCCVLGVTVACRLVQCNPMILMMCIACDVDGDVILLAMPAQ